MTFTFDLYAVLITVLIIFGLVFLGYLILLIRRALALLGQTQRLLEKNEAHLNATLESLPHIARNVENITGELDEAVITAGKLAENVESKFKDGAYNVYDKTETTIEAIQVLGSLIKGGLAYFDRRQKRR